jgi:hypothetical protein
MTIIAIRRQLQAVRWLTIAKIMWLPYCSLCSVVTEEKQQADILLGESDYLEQLGERDNTYITGSYEEIPEKE